MRQVLPTELDSVDVAACYAADARPRPADRAWVMLNMIASVDGATAVDGVSGALGGAGDRTVFMAVRAVADVIVAASATVNAERYGPSRPSEAVRAARRARGQNGTARVAVITGSLGLDLSIPLFSEGVEPRPLVLTGADAPSERRRLVARHADIWEVGTEGVDPHAAFSRLGDEGLDVALVEGGPSLNGQLLEADLVDEVCLSVAPKLAGGTSARIAEAASGTMIDLELQRILVDETGALFLRYTRRSAG